ncbi:TRAP transporter small permease [Pseudoroseicyclus sp. CXY001]|uniref:TRAP transporter small permease n=1 Tax=Pseudoroseicyclus sp. CXY001 TaxID=3242492 RepID=UPI00357144EA
MQKLYTRAEFITGALILSAITGLVFVAAVMRTFGHPLVWSVDLAQLLFIWLCFIGACRALRQRAHLGVDLVIRLLPYRARRWVETGIAILTLAFLAVLAVEGVKLTLLNIERQFGDSGLSYAWVTIAVPVGSLLFAGNIIANLVDAWRSTDRLVFDRNLPPDAAMAVEGRTETI